ncbi:UPF0505 protein C16orf62 homolog [Lingula anatina]|uniref:UPF0505 protein C16orf62 homolog n=1 Tax=Lingula anatina TaxID=7574 RepID=A0A1S3I576_LINAN|nr:UPF0505 protein C16orf62 homolog [Lingula anatina]|eukprot:XP_013393417.1 UPF0505 protein C16orf62 homolog [Lingula anatina]
MATYEWTPRIKHAAIEKEAKTLPKEEVTSHPLKGIVVTEVKKTGKSQVQDGRPRTSSHPLDPLTSAMDGADPLSMFASQADPLSRMSTQTTTKEKSMPKDENNGLDETFEPWSVKKLSILTKHTTSEKLTITTSFLSAHEKDRVVIKAQSTVTDKVKNRLEQLDDFEEGSVQEMLDLSQQEYVNRIDELNQALIDAWDQDQRVKALKIAIQCSKLLSDTNVIQFYPSKFVLITDILDTFGKLVFERIRSKSNYIPVGSSMPIQLPENFTPEQVPDSAKETCRNWFFKIASIRELIPRFYVETAILKCYSFLDTSEYSAALCRLADMTRGMGDPLVGIYARCYLSRVGIAVAPNIRDHLMPCFNDFLACYSQLQSDHVQNTLAMQKVEMPRYLTLYCPALDWILQCIAHRASENTLQTILEKCKKLFNSALLLNSIMSAFKPEYIAFRAVQFTEQIRECEETGFPKHMLYCSLGGCLVLASPPEDQRLAVLNEVWKVVMKLKNPLDYITCAEVWIEYVAKHFSKREVNTILNDVIKHMTPDRAFEDYYPQLQSIVTKVLSHIHDFTLLFSLDKFLPFIDLFQKEIVKVEVCKSIMEAFVKYQAEATSDPVIINALMFICKTMHDSVNALTLDDEVRAIGGLICGFVRKISFGRDFEQQLSFYVEARANFSNLDAVLVELVECVNTLAVETRDVVKGKHSRKTASFVRACAAYCFITIPSLQSVLARLKLYLVSGQVALLNQCLSQGDAFLKAAISLIAEVPKTLDVDGKVRSTEPLMTSYICSLLSTLLAVPDNPDQGVLYLLRGLLNVLSDFPWDVNSSAKAVVYVNVLSLLCAVSQEDYVYHIDRVDANDSMYGSDPKFLGEVTKISATVLEEVFSHLKVLGEGQNFKKQAEAAIEVFNVMVAHGDLSKHQMFTLALNLWGLAQKHGQGDTKQMVRTLDYVKRKAISKDKEGKVFADLASKMHLQSRT